jgi:hypothetical protein
MQTSRSLYRAFQALVFATLGLFCSCDVDLFGLDSKQVAGGYRLTKWGEGGPGFVLFFPNDKGSEDATDIGWRKPFILVRDSTAEKQPDMWTVIDTTSGEKFSLSDEQRKGDARYRDIRIYSATEGWKLLKKRPQW